MKVYKCDICGKFYEENQRPFQPMRVSADPNGNRIYDICAWCYDTKIETLFEKGGDEDEAALQDSSVEA